MKVEDRRTYFKESMISFFNKYPLKKDTKINHAVNVIVMKRIEPSGVGMRKAASALTKTQNATHRNVLNLLT